MPDQIASPRRPWVACLLSLGATGLGQVYCGRLTKGLVLLLASFAFVPVIGFVPKFASGQFMVYIVAVFVVAYFALFVYAMIDSIILARRAGSQYTIKEFNRWYVYVLFIVFSISYPTTYADIIRSHVFQPFKVPSESMTPTILQGDYLLLNKFIYEKQSPERGDIVIFIYPNDRHLYYMKRIIALPGDTV